MDINIDAEGTRYVELPWAPTHRNRRNVVEIAGREWIDICPTGSGEYLSLPNLDLRVTVDGGGAYHSAWRLADAGDVIPVGRFETFEAAVAALA